MDSVMGGAVDTPTGEAGEPDRGAPVGRPEASPLERLASFRFAYGAIFLFLIAYVFTVEALEVVLQQHFEDAVEQAAQVDPQAGSVAVQISERVGSLLEQSPWIRFGDVRVRPLVLGADGRTLLYGGPHLAPAGELDPEIGARLLPAVSDVDLSLAHNTVLANAVLVGYAALLITTLAVYTRRLARRELQQLQVLGGARDAAAQRADAIARELERLQGRLSEVEPENEIYAEEIGALEQQRRDLQARLGALERREDELRRSSSRAQELEDEQSALEELLEEATSEMETKDEELQTLRSQLKRAGRKAGTPQRERDVWERRLRTLYKNLEVDDHALDGILALGDESSRLRAEEALKRLTEEPETAAVRRKVGGLPSHLSIFEMGFAGKGRIYYTRGRSRRTRILAVGAKNSQKPDLEYLSRLPKGT
jgi:predicted  nucleic acid-binding Zn-ribbon protein